MAERNVVTNVLPTWLGKRTPGPNVATTAANRWIDGTAGGSATNNQFGFYTITGVGLMSYQIIDGGVTLSATNATGRGRVLTTPFETTTTQQNVNQYCFRLRPSTSYTLTVKMKGVNIFNATTARSLVLEFTSGGTFVTSNATGWVPAGDSDWATYTATFTTSSTTSFGAINCQINTAGAVMSASYKDFQLDTTTPSTRTTITTPRVSARYMGGSTQFNGTTSTIPTTLTANTAFTSGFVLHGWIYPRSYGEGSLGHIFDKTDDVSGTNGMFFRLQSSGGEKRLQFRVNAGTAVQSATDSIRLQKYQHVIAHVSSNATVSFYINGVLSGTPAATAALSGITTTNPLTIGNRSGATDRTFDGNLAELGIISLAGRGDLTAAEIQALYTNSTRPTGATNFWELDEQPSTYTDSIGGNTGTGTATTYSPDTPVQQRVAVRDMGTALRFDGVDDYVEIPNASIPASTFQNGFTLSAWINPATLGEGSLGNIFDKADGLNGLNGFCFQLTAASQIRFRSNTVSHNSLTGSIPLRTKSFVTVSVDNTGLSTLFINGVQNNGATATGALTAITTTSAMRIGNRSTSTDRTFDGVIDNPRIWSRALTATEIANMYFNNIVPRNGLVAEYLFNEASGSTALDTSGNGNNGTITGATYTTDVPLRPRTSV